MRLQPLGHRTTRREGLGPRRKARIYRQEGLAGKRRFAACDSRAGSNSERASCGGELGLQRARARRASAPGPARGVRAAVADGACAARRARRSAARRRALLGAAGRRSARRSGPGGRGRRRSSRRRWARRPACRRWRRPARGGRRASRHGGGDAAPAARPGRRRVEGADVGGEAGEHGGRRLGAVELLDDQAADEGRQVGGRRPSASSRGPARSGIGLGSWTPLPRWLENRDRVTSAVPGAPGDAGEQEVGIVAAGAVAALAGEAGARRLAAQQQRRAEGRAADLDGERRRSRARRGAAKALGRRRSRAARSRVGAPAGPAHGLQRRARRRRPAAAAGRRRRHATALEPGLAAGVDPTAQLLGLGAAVGADCGRAWPASACAPARSPRSTFSSP